VADIALANGLPLSVYFDQGKIWKLEAVDQRVVDAKGIGVGKQFSEVQTAWSKGALTYGRGDGGPFVNFSQNPNFIYTMVIDGLPDKCFDACADCTLAQNTRVIRLTIYPAQQ
jgi:hypothetical protein